MYHMGIISHMIPVHLYQNLMKDLSLRIKDFDPKGCGRSTAESIDIDAGGMCRIDRRYHKFEIDGLAVDIPSEDVSFMLFELKHLKERKFDDGTPYFKLKGFYYRALVLTPELRDQLLSLMEEKLEECERIAEEEAALWRVAFSDGDLGKHVISSRRDPKYTDKDKN